MILIVMYQPDSQADFAGLHEAIASHGPCARFLESFYLVDTDQSPTDLITALRTRFQGDGRVYACHLTQEHAKFLTPKARAWLTRRHPNTQGIGGE